MFAKAICISDLANLGFIDQLGNGVTSPPHLGTLRCVSPLSHLFGNYYLERNRVSVTAESAEKTPYWDVAFVVFLEM